MAGKTSKKKPTKKKAIVDDKTIRKEWLKVLSGFVCIFLAIYIGLGFISFLFVGGSDQSLLQLNWWRLISDSSIVVENITGKSGAWLADVLINRTFGVASFGFCYLLSLYGYRILNKRTRGYGYVTVKVLLGIIWLSVFLGYLVGDNFSDMTVYPGGMYGYIVSDWLNSFIGKVGTFFVMIALLFAYCIFFFERILVHISDYFTSIKDKKEGWSTVKKPKKKRTVREKKASFTDEDIDDQKLSVDELIEKSDNEEPETPEDEGTFTITEVGKSKLDNESAPISDSDEIYQEPSLQPIESETIIEDDDELEVRRPDSREEIEDSMRGDQVNINTSDAEEHVIAADSPDDIDLTVVKTEDGEELENIPLEDYDPTLDLSNYEYPNIDLLIDYGTPTNDVTDEELKENRRKIVEQLRHFKIEIQKIKANVGPTVTLYEIVPAPGIRISKIKNLEDDIALGLAALGIRIIAPIPGKGTIGIEVPNKNPQMVSMRSIIASKAFQETDADLPVVMGRTISNDTFVFDLTKMPHLLVAGATGQGKSVGINAIITSLLYKKHPSQLKFVFVDPKKVELSLYSIIEKHFLAKMPDEEDPIITDVEKVKATLNSVGIEMDARYDLLKMAHARTIKEYNKKFISRKLNPEKGHRYLPYIVVVVDEFADLIMTAGKEVELPIARIAQLARAVGIHMILATQRPSANIITGIIKANFPSRIAFKVTSGIDSRTILDQAGANQLIGRGDMLFSSGGDPIRLQCAFVDTPEVESICRHIETQQSYATAFLLPEYVGDNEGGRDVDLKQRDEFFEQAAALIVLNQQGSTSNIQRKFSIGYNRAGRIMDQLEAAGIVGPSQGSKARKVLIQDQYSLEQLLNNI